MGSSTRFTRTTRAAATARNTASTRAAATAHETAATVRGTAAHGPAPSAPRGALVLDRYRFHRPLGAGGFGTVWLARDERLERDVAVKVLPRERVLGGRFEREARATARLSHPGIVTLYEAAVDDDGAYLVSELVRGSTFAQLLEAGRLSDRDIVAVGVALCDALEHAHGQGVVHRDVKPSNVLVPDYPVSPGGVAKLTDFGVARLIGGNTLTHTGDVVGTAAYMAPEQAEGREADAAADLYSLSLVLYEALAGVNPIATTAAGRARRLGAHLPPVRRHRRDLPHDLGRSIDLALRPRPRERGSIAELRSGLAASLDEVKDLPGIVEAPWARPVRAAISPGRVEKDAHEWRAPHSRPDRGMQAGPEGPPDRRVRDARAGPHWPERALAAASAALIAFWLIATVAPSPPVAPAGAALIACLAVAALPRVGWLALTLAAAGMLSAQGSAGAALIVLIGALVPIVLLPRSPTLWPLPALAPALGVVLAAGAWPALAGQAKSAWQRAGLGAVGWIWTVLAALLAGRAVYTRLPAGIPAGSVSMGSVEQTVGHVLSPIVGSGVLAPAVVWGAAAAILPSALRGPLARRLVLAAAWSAGVAAATAAALPRLSSAGALRPGALVMGAVAAALVAVIPSFVKRPQGPSPAPDPPPDLA